jgi:penicillin-binding protein 1C
VTQTPTPAGCTGPQAGTALRILGLETGDVLKAVPGQHVVELSVSAQGQSDGQPLYWLLDGQMPERPARGGNGNSLHLSLSQAGTHSLTLMDGSGRFARMVFRVDVR